MEEHSSEGEGMPWKLSAYDALALTAKSMSEALKQLTKIGFLLNTLKLCDILGTAVRWFWNKRKNSSIATIKLFFLS